MKLLVMLSCAAAIIMSAEF